MVVGRETYREERDVQNSKVQGHAQRNGSDQVWVLPYRQPEQTLVLRQRVHGVEHLDGHQDRETHRCRTVCHVVSEHFAADFGEFARALMEMRL